MSMHKVFAYVTTSPTKSNIIPIRDLLDLAALEKLEREVIARYQMIPEIYFTVADTPEEALERINSGMIENEDDVFNYLRLIDVPTGKLRTGDKLLMNPSRTYGDLPSFDEFKHAWAASDVGKYYKIFNSHHNDYLPDGEYTCKELYAIVKRATWRWLTTGDEEAGNAASMILETLGIEWI